MRAAAAAALLGAVALAVAGCGRADSSEPVSFSDISSVIARADLRVCDEAATEARAPGAVEERRYDVGFRCGDDDEQALVVATAYDDVEDRDGAALRFEGQARPPAQGTVWTLGAFTVRVSGDRDPEVVDALTDALEDRGAK